MTALEVLLECSTHDIQQEAPHAWLVSVSHRGDDLEWGVGLYAHVFHCYIITRERGFFQCPLYDMVVDHEGPRTLEERAEQALKVLFDFLPPSPQLDALKKAAG